MADLINELSWSFSRLGVFKECRRKYYWQYYHKWNGWRSDAPESRQKAYLLSKMTTADLYAGDVAHKTIAWSIQRLRTGTKVHFEHLQPRVDGMFQSAFKASRDKEWRLDPKRPNFFEDYYGGGLTDEKMAEMTEKAGTAVANFLKSETFARLSDPRVKVKWLAVDSDRSFSSFLLDDIKVFAEPDLAVQIKDNCYLFDWKTGKRSSDHDDQLVCYALYACSEWDVQPENIVARAVYLNIADPSSGKPVEHPVKYDEAKADAVRDQIRKTYGDMASLVTGDNEADVEDFPKCDRDGVCRRCQFQEMCGSSP